MKRQRNAKNIADDPVYQPTIPLMRLTKEDYYCNNSDEFADSLPSSMDSVDKNIKVQDMVSTKCELVM